MDPADAPWWYPWTSLTILFCSGWWFYSWNSAMDISELCISYEKFVTERQYWRGVTSTYTHLGIMHVGFNMYSLWNLRFAETSLGVVSYMKFTFLLMVVSIFSMMILSHVLITRFGREDYVSRLSAGYSAVLFGWMAYVATFGGEISVFGFAVPSLVYPFLNLALIQLLIPQASFIGHFAGIIAGFALGWNLFDWYTSYLFWCSFFWFIVGLIINVKTTSSLSLPWIEIIDARDPSAPGNQVSVVDGVIQRSVAVPGVQV